jgi:hypothetical protein
MKREDINKLKRASSIDLPKTTATTKGPINAVRKIVGMWFYHLTAYSLNVRKKRTFGFGASMLLCLRVFLHVKRETFQMIPQKLLVYGLLVYRLFHSHSGVYIRPIAEAEITLKMV